MPCVANQLYQETKARKNPTTDGGRLKNVLANTPKPDGTSGTEFVKAAVGSCFFTGAHMNKAIGLPVLLGTVLLPLFTARQLIRYQYRIGSIDDDIIAECCIPCCMYYCCSYGGLICAVGSWGVCTPCMAPPIGYMAQVIMGLEREHLAHPEGKPQYLVGYSPPKQSS